MRGAFSYGGIDVNSPGVSRGGVLNQIRPRMNGVPTNGTRAETNTTGDVDIPRGNPLMVLLGMIVALVIVHFIARSSDSIKAEFFGFNPINVLSIGLIAVVAIALVKLIVAMWPVPGLTQVAAIV